MNVDYLYVSFGMQASYSQVQLHSIVTKILVTTITITCSIHYHSDITYGLNVDNAFYSQPVISYTSGHCIFHLASQGLKFYLNFKIDAHNICKYETLQNTPKFNSKASTFSKFSGGHAPAPLALGCQLCMLIMLCTIRGRHFIV